MKEGDNGCSSHSPIKLGRNVISVTKRNFCKEMFKHGAIHLTRLSVPLTPFFVKKKKITK